MLKIYFPSMIIKMIKIENFISAEQWIYLREITTFLSTNIYVMNEEDYEN